MRPTTVLCLLAVASCHRHHGKELDSALTRQEAEVNALQTQHRDQVEQVDEIVAAFTTAQDQFTDAQAVWREARKNFGAATDDYRRAKADYDAAERWYRIVVAAMASYAAARGVCSTAKSKEKLRRELRRTGVDLTGKDIDHIWPKSRGGIDHPLNFEVMEASLNRSLGNDIVRKFLHSPMGIVVGLATSAAGVLGGCN
jgi:hypothetical protein